MKEIPFFYKLEVIVGESPCTFSYIVIQFGVCLLPWFCPFLGFPSKHPVYLCFLIFHSFTLLVNGNQLWPIPYTT